MAISRVAFWSSTVLHGTLLGALMIGGPTATERARRVPPRSTIDCSEVAPPPSPAPQFELPPTFVEPITPDDVPLAVLEIETPTTLLTEPTPATPDADRRLPTRLDAAFAACRLRVAPPTPPIAVVPQDAAPVVAPEAARVLSPLPGSNPPPDYPAVARRRGWQGTVLVMVECDAAGVVTSAAIVRSSGHAVLDEAALAAVRRWRFAGGPGCSEQPIEFRLTAAAAAGP